MKFYRKKFLYCFVFRKHTVFLSLFLICLTSNAQQPKLVLPVGHTNKIITARFSPDGMKVVTASLDGTAKLWDAATGYLLADLKIPKYPLHNAWFSPDGKKIITHSSLTGIYDKETGDILVGENYQLWDAATGKRLNYLKNLDSSLKADPVFSPDSKKIIITTGKIRTWNAENGKLITVLKNGTLNILSSQFSPDGKWILTTNDGNTIGIWDPVTGLRKQIIGGFTAPVKTIHFTEDKTKIIAASMNETIILDAVKWNTLKKISGKLEGEDFFSFSPDAKKILTASFYEEPIFIKLWEADSRSIIDSLRGRDIPPDNEVFMPFSGRINGSPVSLTNNQVAAVINTTYYDNLQFGSDNDKNFYLWNITNTKVIDSIKAHNKSINFIRFSSDGKKILTASDDKTAKIWDASTGNLLTELKGHTTNTGVLVFLQSNNILLAGSDDGTLRIWDITTGKLLDAVNQHPGDLHTVQFNADSTKIITASRFGTAKILDLKTKKTIDLLDKASFRVDPTTDMPETNSITGLNPPEISSDGTKALTAIHTTELTIYNTSDGSKLYSIQPSNGLRRISFAHFSPDGKKIITGWQPENPNSQYDKKDTTIAIWDALTGKLIYKIRSNDQWLFDAFFSRDNSKIFILSDGKNKVQVHDAADGRKLIQYAGQEEWLLAAELTRDGKKILLGSANKSVNILDSETGKAESKLLINAEPRSIKLSPDENKLLVHGRDNSITIIELSTAKVLFKLDNHQQPVSSICFSPDNKYLVSSSEDNTIKLWSTADGKLLNTFFSVDSIDYFNILASGYYYGSVNAAKQLHYVTSKMDAISFEQLDVKYNRPDKILESVGNPDSTLVKSYRIAYEKRIKKLGLSPELMGNNFNVPEADFANRNEIEYRQNEQRLKLQIKSSDKISLLNRFNIWINEVPQFGSKGLSIRKRNSFDTTITVPLSDGVNRIETSVTNSNGAESYRKPLIVKYEPEKPVDSKTWFIGIGINNFKDSLNNLKWCVQDIRDLVVMMKKKYGNQLEIVDTLFNENVTLQGVKGLKQKLLTTGINDKVIISYSGHGLLSKDFDYYLSSFNTNFGKPEEGGILYDEFENLLDSIPARKKILFLDACHSGELDKDDLQIITAAEKSLAKNNVSTNTGHKGVDVTVVEKSEGVGLKNSFELMQSLFVNVGKGTGATVISASAGVQFAQERSDLGHGVFTYSLIEAMQQFKTIKISALKKYVGDRVTALTNGLQKPTARNELITVDWDVW